MNAVAHSFEAMSVGLEFGPLTQILDEHVAKAYAFSVDDYSAFSSRGHVDRSAPAYSAWAAKRLMHLYMLTVFDPQGVKAVHLKEDFEFFAPVHLGSKLTMQGRCVDKFVRKGRPMIACETEAVDENGRVVVRQRSLEIVPALNAEALTDSASQDTNTRLSDRRVEGIPVQAATLKSLADFQGGKAILPSISKLIHQDQIGVFCGADEGWQNLHTSVEIARQAGYDRPLMSGLIHSCWFSELLAGFFGPGIASGMRLGSTYLRPVQAGSHVVCHGQIVGSSGEAIEVELWSEADGKIAASGFATVPVPQT